MGFVGIIHLIGVLRESDLLAWLTSIARLITGTVFLALFYAGKIDALALLVGFYDIAYALLYLLSRKSA
jgi:cytochrome c oxidase cbb3-type subunit I